MKETAMDPIAIALREDIGAGDITKWAASLAGAIEEARLGATA